MDLKPYDSADGVALRLMKTNPRLASDKACWLARHWAARTHRGAGISWATRRKIVNPHLYRVDEALALYAPSPPRALGACQRRHSLSRWWKGRYTLQDYHAAPGPWLTAAASWCRTPAICCTDQPQAVAALIEDFLATRCLPDNAAPRLPPRRQKLSKTAGLRSPNKRIQLLF